MRRERAWDCGRGAGGGVAMRDAHATRRGRRAARPPCRQSRGDHGVRAAPGLQRVGGPNHPAHRARRPRPAPQAEVGAARADSTCGRAGRGGRRAVCGGARARSQRGGALLSPQSSRLWRRRRRVDAASFAPDGGRRGRGAPRAAISHPRGCPGGTPAAGGGWAVEKSDHPPQSCFRRRRRLGRVRGGGRRERHRARGRRACTAPRARPGARHADRVRPEQTP